METRALTLGDESGRVVGVRIARNRIELDGAGRLAAVPTGEEEVIACGMVVRSIGYRGEPLPGIPFDDRRGLIRNDGGSIDDDGIQRPGEYAAGWIKRGPSGVIGTNKKCAADTVQRILDARDAGRLAAPQAVDAQETWLRAGRQHLVTWNGWLAIDARERAAGAPLGRPRVKFVSTWDLHGAAEELLPGFTLERSQVRNPPRPSVLRPAPAASFQGSIRRTGRPIGVI